MSDIPGWKSNGRQSGTNSWKTQKKWTCRLSSRSTVMTTLFPLNFDSHTNEQWLRFHRKLETVEEKCKVVFTHKNDMELSVKLCVSVIVWVNKSLHVFFRTVEEHFTVKTTCYQSLKSPSSATVISDHWTPGVPKQPDKMYNVFVREIEQKYNVE